MILSPFVTSPLHSQGSQKKGDKINGCQTLAFLGA